MIPLAHAGGVDEILALVVPAVFIWAWHVGRREDAAAGKDAALDASPDRLTEGGARP